jgi:hypothetical protein
LKNWATGPSLSQRTYRVVPDMRRTATPERLCRRCPFCAPSGRCLERTIRSGHCGDWIWFVRHSKQIRRPYVRPHDPRTPAQLRSRARLSAASRNYSYSLTQKQRAACITAGAKLRSRLRLAQSAPLTGQQYSIRRQYALQKAHGNGMKSAIAPQVAQPQKLNRTTWERYRGASVVAPEHRRLRARLSRKPRGGTKERRVHEEWGLQTILHCLPKDSSNLASGNRAGRPGPSPEPRRSTLDPDRGYYGEAPARPRRGYGGAAGLSECGPGERGISPETVKNRNGPRKHLKIIELRGLLRSTPSGR